METCRVNEKKGGKEDINKLLQHGQQKLFWVESLHACTYLHLNAQV